MKPGTLTAYADLDWDHYILSRPEYPSSLKDLIYSYRRGQPKIQWERLVDIGGGVGISAALFAQDFDIVHLLDPSPANHEKARVFLQHWVDKLHLNTKLEFTISTAERGHGLVQNADLAICATAAHFIDGDEFITSAASMLRPGGTLAVYTYWMPTFPTQSGYFNEVYIKAAAQLTAFSMDPEDDEARSILSNLAARASAGDGLLDFLPVPEELFGDVRRIRINPDAGLERWSRNFPVPFQPYRSRVGEKDIRFSYDSREDVQAEGWYTKVDNKWLQGYVSTMRVGNKVNISDAQLESVFGEWDKVFASECPSGFVHVLWPVYVVLATRK